MNRKNLVLKNAIYNDLCRLFHYLTFYSIFLYNCKFGLVNLTHIITKYDNRLHNIMNIKVERINRNNSCK